MARRTTGCSRDALLAAYSDTALRQVWRAQHFSYATSLTENYVGLPEV